MFIHSLLAVAVLLVFSGCATTRGKASDRDQLQARVVDLEKKLEEKDSEIVDLQYEVKDLSSKVASANSESMPAEPQTTSSSAPSNSDIIKVNVSSTKVQTALKNAGHYNGKIDGKIGPGTKAAIVEFQKAEGLTSDGVIGRKTWDALKKHL